MKTSQPHSAALHPKAAPHLQGQALWHCFTRLHEQKTSILQRQPVVSFCSGTCMSLLHSKYPDSDSASFLKRVRSCPLKSQCYHICTCKRRIRRLTCDLGERSSGGEKLGARDAATKHGSSSDTGPYRNLVKTRHAACWICKGCLAGPRDSGGQPAHH